MACTALSRQSFILVTHNVRAFSLSATVAANKNYKLVIVGGGTGGSAISSKFGRKLGPGNVAVIEPSDKHYYQPMWTLVGAGIKNFEQSVKDTKNCIPSSCEWLKTKVVTFDPENNTVVTANGDQIKYEYLVVATGFNLDYHKIKGLEEAMKSDPQVCSNFHRQYVTKTYPALQRFKGGNAIFTFPNTPIKCAGAPQKIMYLAEEIFRKNNVRKDTKVIFNTSLGVIFGVKKYAERLQKIVKDRNITVNFRTNLIEVKPETREAIFEKLDNPGETETFKYDFLHVAPPMSTCDEVKKSPLANEAGFIDVNKDTLQHVKYRNVFAIGDCSSLPTSKTAAAAAAQSGVLSKNLTAAMNNEQLKGKYDGYTSCPLITSSKTCILAEFDYDGQPMETFPLDQGKERRTMYILKKDFMPHMYWQMLIKGMWNGPAIFRKAMSLGMKK